MRTVKMTELEPGMAWYLHGGWHRVTSVQCDDMGGNWPGQRRSYVRVQALTPRDGEHTYGMSEWGTALRLDLAAERDCLVEVEL